MVIDRLIEALAAQGYQRFDPFPGGNGTPAGIKETIRLFVTPPIGDEETIRVIGILPDGVTLPFDHLRLWLAEDDCGISAYKYGVTEHAALLDSLQAGKTPDDLAAIQQRAAPDVAAGQRQTPGNLPPELAQFAQTQGVNPQQADKLISRITGQLFGKMDRQSGGEAGAMKDQAKALLGQTNKGVDWHSAPAQKLLAMAALLMLPAAWREPDFEALREAYQVARRLARNPKALLLPDEKQALAAVPDAITYQAVYVGK